MRLISAIRGAHDIGYIYKLLEYPHLEQPAQENSRDVRDCFSLMDSLCVHVSVHLLCALEYASHINLGVHLTCASHMCI